MIIIEKPYASEFLIDTIVQNDWGVLDNTAVEEADIEEGAFDLISSDIAKNYYLTQEYPLIYSNSENAITWVLKNLPDSNLSNYIKLFKDKIEIYLNYSNNKRPDDDSRKVFIVLTKKTTEISLFDPGCRRRENRKVRKRHKSVQISSSKNLA